MIDVVKQTPLEYSKQSRDYQILARLYSAIFNLSKMYIDDMSVWEKDIDNKLSILRARTLNFKTTHTWDQDELEEITYCFKYLMRNKGTKLALEACINIIMKINHIDVNPDSNLVSIDGHEITINIEGGTTNLGVIEDLLKYLLPAGVTYRVNTYKTYSVSRGALFNDVFISDEDLVAYWYAKLRDDGSLVGKHIGTPLLIGDTYDGPPYDSEGYPIIPDPTLSRKEDNPVVLDLTDSNKYPNIPDYMRGKRKFYKYITNTYIYDNSEGQVIINEIDEENEGGN